MAQHDTLDDLFKLYVMRAYQGIALDENQLYQIRMAFVTGCVMMFGVIDDSLDSDCFDERMEHFAGQIAQERTKALRDLGMMGMSDGKPN